MAKKSFGSTKNISAKKQIPNESESTDRKKLVWDLNSVDKNGLFCFDTSRKDFSCEKVLNFMLTAGNRTWYEIKTETHDKSGKSKNHFLSYNSITQRGKERISALSLDEQTDSIFSLRLDNKIRIIGIRDGEKFIVKWYDPNHEFSMVTK